MSSREPLDNSAVCLAATGATESPLRWDELFWGGYCLQQNPDWFCFGDDSVLLADFVVVRPGDRLLDLGCGNGVLLLLLAAREPSLGLWGLELSPENAELAAANLAANEVAGRIVQGDYGQAGSLFAPGSFERIVINPPYYPKGSGRPCADPVRQLARYESCCTLARAVEQAAPLLSERGTLSAVIPLGRRAELFAAAQKAGLRLGRSREVAPKEGQPPHLLLAEFGPCALAQTLPPLALRTTDGSKTPAMERIRRGE